MKFDLHRAQLFSPCPRGLELALAEELTELGVRDPAPVEGGVSYGGDLALCYRVNLASRIASRVLWQVGQGTYRDEQDVYDAVSRLPWPAWFGPSNTLRVNVAGKGCPLKSLDYVTLRIKDAVCDRFRLERGRRPDVDTRSPDVRIYAFLEARRLTLYLDTSGEPLFKRGLRTASGEAPIRENLAAGILRLAAWKPGVPLLDPMCGSGTFLLEAAQTALQVPAGLRRSFAFEKLAFHSPRLWREVRHEAESRIRRTSPGLIWGCDADARAVRMAAANLQAAGLSDVVQLRRADVLELLPPTPTGILVANPPYAVRLGQRDALGAFYPRLGDALKARFAGWNVYLLTADLRLPRLIRLKPSRRVPLFNGALECRLFEFRMVEGKMARKRAETTEEHGGE
jgi:putative N6-adenine-specific DNA methylase